MRLEAVTATHIETLEGYSAAAVDCEVSLVASHEDIKRLAERVASKFMDLEFPKFESPLLANSLLVFLQTIYSRPGPWAMAFADRRETYLPPILDMYLVRSSPISLTADAQEIREIRAKHAKICLQFEPCFSWFLTVADTRQYPTLEVLTSNLSARVKPPASLQFIACAQL